MFMLVKGYLLLHSKICFTHNDNDDDDDDDDNDDDDDE